MTPKTRRARTQSHVAHSLTQEDRLARPPSSRKTCTDGSDEIRRLLVLPRARLSSSTPSSSNLSSDVALPRDIAVTPRGAARFVRRGRVDPAA